jgi:hypothetical protein
MAGAEAVIPGDGNMIHPDGSAKRPRGGHYPEQFCKGTWWAARLSQRDVQKMYRCLTLLTLIILALAACGGTPHDTPAPAIPIATRAAQPIQTSTPTPVGTWEMVIEGMIYDLSTGKPISGASISYVVVHSFFPEIQEGRPNTTISDENGKFSLPMIVHDTDNIRIVVEAPGFRSYEEKLDLFGDRSLNIGLTS